MSNEDDDNLLISLNGLASAFHTLGNITNAIKFSSEAIKIGEDLKGKLGEEFTPDMAHSLTNSYNIKGLALSDTVDFKNSVVEFEKAIKILEDLKSKLGEKFTLSMANSLAGSYNNIGKALYNIGFNIKLIEDEDHNKAVEDFNNAVVEFEKAIKIFEDLKKKPGEEFTPDMALSSAIYYNSNGAALSIIGDYTKTVEEYKKAAIEYGKAIKILEDLKKKPGEEFTPVMAHSLAVALTNKGHNLFNINDNTKAINENDKAIKILEDLKNKLGEEFTTDMAYSLAVSFSKKGYYLSEDYYPDDIEKNKEYKKAAKEYDNAIKIMEYLRTKLEKEFTPDMADSLILFYYSKGTVLFDIQKFEEALESINNALRLDPNNKQFIAFKNQIKKI